MSFNYKIKQAIYYEFYTDNIKKLYKESAIHIKSVNFYIMNTKLIINSGM